MEWKELAGLVTNAIRGCVRGVGVEGMEGEGGSEDGVAAREASIPWGIEALVQAKDSRLPTVRMYSDTNLFFLILF